MSKNLYLILFYEINISQATIFKLYTFYKNHEMIKTDNQVKKNHKCSNNFAFDCMRFTCPNLVFLIEISRVPVFESMKENVIIDK